jgi:hypothetical protein
MSATRLAAEGEDVVVRVGIDIGGTFTDLVALGGDRLATANLRLW